MSQEYLSWLREYYRKLYQTPILENFLELEIIDLEKGKSSFRAETTKMHGNMYGTVHGGTLASIADIVMGTSCLTLGKRVVTIDMSISYIKSPPVGSKLTAKGKVISKGKTIMRAVGEIYDEQDQLMAKSHASYYVTGDFGENEQCKTNPE